MDNGSAMTASGWSSLRLLRSFADRSSFWLTSPEPSAIADSVRLISRIGQVEGRRSQ